MWVDVSGRHQPGDGATRAEPVAQSLFSRLRERRPPGGTAGTSWWLGCSCHPMQLALQLARPSRRNSVHKCPEMAPRGHFGQSVYTPDFPAPVRNGATAQQCTQMPQSGAERPDPPICVRYCDPKATYNPSPRRNSVHKCPETAPRGHFRRSVYTPVSPSWRRRPRRPGGDATTHPHELTKPLLDVAPSDYSMLPRCRVRPLASGQSDSGTGQQERPSVCWTSRTSLLLYRRRYR